jgi:23S rRNA (cytosine1962-C5)-methyltransferase
LRVDLGLLASALERRKRLLERLAAEGTDCYRLFHGIAEGLPGVAIDRYGPIFLLQTWREPLDAGEVDRIHAEVERRLEAKLVAVWNHRAKEKGVLNPNGARAKRVAEREPWGWGPTALRGVPFAQFHDPEIPEALVGRELGLRYDVRPRHRGLDPLLFLDLRMGRRRLLAHSGGKSVLNLFAYTCASGLAASAGGAREVWNVDFSRSALEVGEKNLAANELAPETTRFIAEDVIAVSRQLAGLPLSATRGRGLARRQRRFARFEPRSFDLVILDPPTWSKGSFGAVDVIRDYPSLLKPALLATSEGGVLLATNHAPEVSRDSWLRVLERTARNCGRSIRDLEWLSPEEDFPSFDAAPPLKVAWMTV